MVSRGSSTDVDIPEPEAGPGQKLYDVSTAGVNYADTHQIENSYLAQQQLPLIPGAEFVGTPVGGGQRVVGLLRSEEHTSELQSHVNLVCRLLLEKKK